MNVIRYLFSKRGVEHLSDAALFELQQGRLSPARLASVQQHLFVCRECLRAFKDVSDFFSPPQADEVAPSNEQIEAGWQELKERLPWSATRSFQAAPTAARAATASTRRLLPLAAGLLVTLGLAGLFVWRGQQTETRLAQTSNMPSQSPPQASSAANARPTETTFDQHRAVGRAKLETPLARQQGQAAQPSFPIGELLATSGQKAATDVAQAQPRFVPAQAQTFSLKLRIYSPLDYSAFRVELLDSQRRILQTVDGKLTKDLAIEAIFQRAGLADGKYFLRVTGTLKQNNTVEPWESALEITARNN